MHRNCHCFYTWAKTWWGNTCLYIYIYKIRPHPALWKGGEWLRCICSRAWQRVPSCILLSFIYLRVESFSSVIRGERKAVFSSWPRIPKNELHWVPVGKRSWLRDAKPPYLLWLLQVWPPCISLFGKRLLQDLKPSNYVRFTQWLWR